MKTNLRNKEFILAHGLGIQSFKAEKAWSRRVRQLVTGLHREEAELVTGLHREEAESDAFWDSTPFLCWSGASTVRDLFLKWFHLGGGGACL